MTTRLWVDTDVGGNPDDAVALLAAASHPDVELVGVSTVSGDTEWRAAEARGILAAGDHEVEVVAGPPPPAALRDVDALLAVGPLTNVGMLVTRGGLPARVAVMGGAVDPVAHRGVLQRVEHNFGSDPGAAARVVDATDGLVVTPLDVSARLTLDGAREARLRRAAPLVGEQIDRWRRHRGEHAVCFHDPLALLAVLGEPMLRIEPATLVVGALGVLERQAGGRHRLVVDVDVDAAIERVLALVGG